MIPPPTYSQQARTASPIASVDEDVRPTLHAAEMAQEDDDGVMKAKKMRWASSLERRV